MNKFLRLFQRNQEPQILGSILMICFLIWGFMHLGGHISQGDEWHYDKNILYAMRHSDNPDRAIGSDFWQEYMHDLSALGSAAFLSIISLSIIGFFLLIRKYRLALFTGICLGCGSALSIVLKSVFERPRPDIINHLVPASFSSFPSGHTMSASIIYLTLGALLSTLTNKRSLKIYIFIWIGLILFGVGASRVYLGVHWPSDVLGGWMIGTSWTLACWMIEKHTRITKSDQPSNQKTKHV